MFKKSYVCGVQKALYEAGMLAYENEAEAAKQAAFVASIAFESEDVSSIQPISPEERTEKVAHLLLGLNEMDKVAFVQGLARRAGTALGNAVVSLARRAAPVAGNVARGTGAVAKRTGETLWKHKGKTLVVGLSVPGAVAVTKQQTHKDKPYGPPKTPLGN